MSFVARIPWRLVLLVLFLTSCAVAEEIENLNDVASDLVVPEVVMGPPQAGVRVWQKIRDYQDWDAQYALYLPTDWEAGRRYPVIFEYPGNGGYQNALGDRSDGTVEGCRLGYGLSAGRGMIWVSLPFVDPTTKAHARNWWGDPEETVRFCKLTIARVCEEFGGDPRRLVLTGFSRGALACNYIGLRDDEIAKQWRALMPYSHYDGVRKWVYADSDSESALKRLKRLGQRPQFITHEKSTDAVRAYLQQASAIDSATIVTLPFPNHSADWVLKDLPVRKQARDWLTNVLKDN